MSVLVTNHCCNRTTEESFITFQGLVTSRVCCLVDVNFHLWKLSSSAANRSGYRLFIAGFFLCLLFDREEGCGTILRRVGCLLPDYTTLHPRRQFSSQSPLWDPQIQNKIRPAVFKKASRFYFTPPTPRYSWRSSMHNIGLLLRLTCEFRDVTTYTQFSTLRTKNRAVTINFLGPGNIEEVILLTDNAVDYWL
jgi:hypothetical protein